MENTKSLFWKDMNLLMEHITQLEKYQTTGRIVPLTKAAVSGNLVRFGGYSWIVICIDEEESAFLLLTSKLLAIRPMKYHGTDGPVTWEDSDMRKYLNETFYKKLHPDDQAKVMETTHQTPATPRYDTPGGNETTDMVFLFNLDEMVKYLGDSGQLMKKGWIHEEHIDYSKPCLIDDEYNNMRHAKNEFGEDFPYWLRSAGRGPEYVTIVRADGVIDMCGEATSGTAGVRPAMWVRL